MTDDDRPVVPVVARTVRTKTGQRTLALAPRDTDRVWYTTDETYRPHRADGRKFVLDHGIWNDLNLLRIDALDDLHLWWARRNTPT